MCWSSDVVCEPSEAAPASPGYELCHFGTVYGKRTPRVLMQAMGNCFNLVI